MCDMHCGYGWQCLTAGMEGKLLLPHVFVHVQASCVQLPGLVECA
jgi:hypothetical protein